MYVSVYLLKLSSFLNYDLRCAKIETVFYQSLSITILQRYGRFLRELKLMDGLGLKFQEMIFCWSIAKYLTMITDCQCLMRVWCKKELFHLVPLCSSKGLGVLGSILLDIFFWFLNFQTNSPKI